MKTAKLKGVFHMMREVDQETILNLFRLTEEKTLSWRKTTRRERGGVTIDWYCCKLENKGYQLEEFCDGFSTRSVLKVIDEDDEIYRIKEWGNESYLSPLLVAAKHSAALLEREESTLSMYFS